MEYANVHLYSEILQQHESGASLSVPVFRFFGNAWGEKSRIPHSKHHLLWESPLLFPVPYESNGWLEKIWIIYSIYIIFNDNDYWERDGLQEKKRLALDGPTWDQRIFECTTWTTPGL